MRLGVVIFVFVICGGGSFLMVGRMRGTMSAYGLFLASNQNNVVTLFPKPHKILAVLASIRPFFNLWPKFRYIVLLRKACF